MEKFYGNYLGICINNADPDYRGRVQIFIPHIMPALYEGWNKEGIDIKIECVGDNLENALSKADIDQLKKMLPWAEAASPVFGNSVAGHYNPQSGQLNPTYGTENQVAAAASGNAGGANISGSLVDFVKEFEGFNPNAYWDNGQWSIGYGTFAGSNRAAPDVSGPITTEEASARLQEELSEAAGYVNSALSSRNITLTQRQIDALTSFTYNLGPGNPSGPVNEAGGLRQLLDSDGGRKDWSTISQAIPSYNKGGGQVLAGLVRRRNNEVSFGNYGGTTTVPNDPTASPLPGSTSPAQYNPHISLESPVHLKLSPSQEAIQATPAAASTAGIGGGSTGSNVNGAVRAAANSVGNIYGNSYGGKCHKATRALVSVALGQPGFFGAGVAGAKYAIGSGYWLKGGYYEVLHASGSDKTGYQIQEGDIAISTGGEWGHVKVVLGGQFRSDNLNDSAANVLKTSTEIYRLTEKGRQAWAAGGYGDAGLLGEALPDNPANNASTEDSAADGTDTPSESELTRRMVRNPTTIQPTVTDTTGMPQGVFSVPNPGAMLWVFFREGDPLFPVYFAASFGAREWKNAYNATSQGAHYPSKDDTTPRNAAMIVPSQAGGMSFVDTKTDSEDCRSVRLFHANGGHLEFHVHGSTLYQPNEHIQQVAGNAYNSCLNREDWTQGTNNSVTIGDRITIVGNMSQEALDIIEQHAQIVKDINKNMLKNGGGGGSSGGSASSNQGQSTTSNNTTFFYDNLVSGVITPGEAALMRTGINVVDVTTPASPKINNEPVTPTVYQGSTLNATQQQNLGPALTQ